MSGRTPRNAIGGGKPILSREDLRPIELRVLKYIDQHGKTNRHRLVADLCSPESRIGRGIENGTNSFIPAIAARWCKRLIDGGLIVDVHNRHGHEHYIITGIGKSLIREGVK